MSHPYKICISIHNSMKMMCHRCPAVLAIHLTVAAIICSNCSFSSFFSIQEIFHTIKCSYVSWWSQQYKAYKELKKEFLASAYNMKCWKNTSPILTVRKSPQNHNIHWKHQKAEVTRQPITVISKKISCDTKAT